MKCHLCGTEFMMDTFAGHLDICEENFIEQEGLKPEEARRELPSRPPAPEAFDKNLAQDVLEAYNKAANEVYRSLNVGVCEYCGREFLHEKMGMHQGACNEFAAFAARAWSRSRISVWRSSSHWRFICSIKA